MSIRIIKISPPKEETMSSNWSKRTSVYGRSLGSLRSAQHKYARRCNYKKLIHVSLEIAASKCPRAAFDYMATILVEDKFPEGANFIHQHQMISKQLNKMSYNQQQKEITQMAYILGTIKSDRHPCNLSRLALELAKSDKVPHDPELKMARTAERILLRMKRRKEMPTPEDISEEEGMRRLKQLLFKNISYNRYNMALFNVFKKNWEKGEKGTDRLYIYNLVARNFHQHNKNPTYVPIISVPEMKQVELDDYVFDQHTYEGRKRKRGMDHFLKEGAKLENTADNIAERAGVKRKAERISMEDSRRDGRIGGSTRERKRIRDTFNDLVEIRSSPVLSVENCVRPSGNKPKKMHITTEDGNLFVKGPYRSASDLDFQLNIDKEKEKYGLIKMDIDITCEGGLYYLTCPWRNGFEPMTSNKMYNNTILWNLLKILIFRAVFDVKKTTLKKILVNMSTNEVMSIGETSNKRARARANGIIHKMFTKLPNEMMCKQIQTIIHTQPGQFKKEVSQFGRDAEMLFL